MDTPYQVARLLHVTFGVFWAGSMIFHAIFLVPAIRDVGADGGKIATALMKRHFLSVVSVAAAVTILAGFYLYWRNEAVSAGAFLRSLTGRVVLLGALASIAAITIDAFFMAPRMMKAEALTRSAASHAPEHRDKVMAEVLVLETTAGKLGQWIAGLLAFAAATMAIGGNV